MKKSSIKCQQINESLQNQDHSFDQPLQVAKDQIETIRQKVLKNDYEPTSEILKIEVIGEHQKKELQQFMFKLNGQKPFKNEQEQKQFFTQDLHQESKKSLKIVKKKYVGIFCAFYKDLKKNSSFPSIIPNNTIVIAKNYDQILWPAKIVKVQHVNQQDYFRRFIYKVNFIDSQISYSLVKNQIIEFTPQNIEKIKKFFNNKKLNKALKIADKMFNQQGFENNKVFQTKDLENIIRLKQISLRTPIKLQNNQKGKPNNLVIETQRITQQLIVNNQSQTDSDQQQKDDSLKKILQKDFCNNKTYVSLQEHISQQMSFQDNNDLIKIKPTKQKQQLLKCVKQKQKQKQKKQKLLLTISSYISRYKRQLKEIKSRPKEKTNSCIENFFDFFQLPLTDFEIEYFLKYSTIIDSFLLFCSEQYFNLKDQDRQFIKRSKEVLIKFYHTLKNHEGQSEFIKGLKILQLSKLKNFEENFLKTKITGYQ